ncbi:hypothetical protein FQN53_003390 [Emmonsiellopsis sp. PD_33]|nr:hypothetical protein FQN53_003390 [Emmonsiellopsis sp. PD_33]
MENEVLDHAAGPASNSEQMPSTEGKRSKPTDESLFNGVQYTRPPFTPSTEGKREKPTDESLSNGVQYTRSRFRPLPPLPFCHFTNEFFPPIKTIWLKHLKEPETGVAGPGWAYHRPQDNYRGRGTPNYIPEWELIQEGDNWYHIDDANRSCPVIFPSANRDGPVARYVPYSFVSRTGTSASYITHEYYPREKLDLRQVETSLGSLYSVPSDYRFNLSFEKPALRFKMAEGTADRFLEKIRALFDSWRTFSVLDFDEHMKVNVYKAYNPSGLPWKDPGKDTIDERHPYWLASGLAMLAERETLDIPPTSLIFSKTAVSPRDRDRPPQCPWYRILHCGGLESALTQQISREFAEPENIVDMLFDFTISYRHLRSPHDDKDMHRYLTDIFKLHLSCHHRYPIANPYSSVGFRQQPFHLTWFRIMEETGQTGAWKSGKLYGDKNGRKIQEAAFTLDYIYEPPRTARKFDHSYHWTVLLLSPKHMHINTESFTWPPSVILNLIWHALRDVSDSWEEIASHFVCVLNDQDAIFDPQMHDSLLFDDDTFSRSRLYFWAMDSLEVFKDRVADAVKQWEFFWKARHKIFQAHEENLISRFKSAGFDDPFFKAKLRSRYRVDDVAKEIETQLFNASSVVESRAATQLGENVRLLTYVSIVYLPLGFCAALWSINEKYSVPNFAIVTVVIGLTTYILVSNLNNAVHFAKRTFRKVKTPVVDRMKHDPDKIWSDRATRFAAFRPEREKVEPSLWYIPQYMFIETLRKLGLSKRPPGDLAEEPKPKPSKSGKPPNNPSAAKEASEKTTKQPAKNDAKLKTNQTSEPHESHPPDDENLNPESNSEGTKTLRFLSRPAYYWMKLKRRRGPAQQDGAEREV